MGGGGRGRGSPPRHRAGSPAVGTAGRYLPLSWRCCSSWITSAMPSSGTCRCGGGGHTHTERVSASWGHPPTAAGPQEGSGAHQSMIEVEGADVIRRYVGGGQRLGDLRHDAAFVWGGKRGTPGVSGGPGGTAMGTYRESITPKALPPSKGRMGGGGTAGGTRPPRPNSPKPRGCPPIRTIRHSSPVELVSSRSLGNLREGGPECKPLCP